VEIMRLVASGLSNAEIAKARGIEEASVAKAVARLISQLDLSSTHARSPRVLITQAYFGFVAGAMPTRIGTSTS
ncbi:MAG: LuxR C-terminal-related transcriptional regulator, partial [Candidatus Nanopelagicales bacterium]